MSDFFRCAAAADACRSDNQSADFGNQFSFTFAFFLPFQVSPFLIQGKSYFIRVGRQEICLTVGQDKISQYAFGILFCPVSYNAGSAVFQRNAGKNEKKEKRDTRPPRPANAERLIAKTEREIAALEGKISAIEREEAENAADYQKLMELGEQKAALDEQLMALYEKWEELNG